MVRKSHKPKVPATRANLKPLILGLEIMADSKTTISITVTKEKLRELVVNHLQTLVNVDFDPKKVVIETRSKQNYKSEWENADFRAKYEVG